MQNPSILKIIEGFGITDYTYICMSKKNIEIIDGKKECSTCHQMLPLEMFAHDKIKQFGLRSSCRECQHKYYSESFEKFSTKRQAYRENNRLEINARKRRYYKNNQPKIRKVAKLRYLTHKDEILQKSKEWRTNSPKGKYLTCRCGAKIRNLEFNITQEQFASEIKKPCSYCGTTQARIGIDRIDNTKGYTPNNICACCFMCNWMKMASTVQTFLTQCQTIVDYAKSKSQHSQTCFDSAKATHP